MKTVIRNNYTPELQDYCNTLVQDKELDVIWFFDADGVFTKISATSKFTNERLGTIIGSTQLGKVSADPSGTGTVNGFAELHDEVKGLAPVAKSGDYNDLTNRPTAMKNPFPIHIGDKTYDGSTEVDATPHWGDIEGTLADQTDLQDALNGKANAGSVYLKGETYNREEIEYRIGDMIGENGTHITMTTTDPGEGSALAPNHFIGVYR